MTRSVLADIAPSDAPQWEAPPPVEERGKAKILIVDDDERNAFAVSTVLDELGQILVVARSGEEALRQLLNQDFAVILLDLHMPGMDGYETAALIRARQRTRHIPIVFLTAVFRDESHLFQAYSAGAVDMVFKPADPFVLKAKVSVFVDLYLKTAEIQREAELRHRLQEENVRVTTEKLMAERALRLAQDRQEAILKFLPVVVTSRGIEPPFAPLFVSDSVERVTGFPAERFVEDPGFGSGRIHPDDREQTFSRLAASPETGSYEAEYRWLCADGTYRILRDQGVIAPAEEGKPRELFGTLFDVTERRQLEQQLLQAQKMEAVGQLTGGLAHDFNNLLTVILGNVDLITKRVSGDARSDRQFAAMRHAAERGQSLTRQLLAFSRRQHLAPEAVDVNALIRSFGPLMRQALGESNAFDLALADGVLASFVDTSQLEAALLNLAVNARDAMPDGGRLTVASRLVTGDEELALRVPEAGRGPWVVVAVEDNGVGMPAEVLERVFEPFFTTKEAGKGSGLGLSQVYGFVRQSGGYVLMDSGLGEGTWTRLYLPYSSDSPPRRLPAEENRGPERGNGEAVLLVEDDPSVLSLALEMLTELGYRVISASDAAGALAVLDRGEPVDLIFSDVVMPGGKTGVQLADEARALRPGIKILLTSGYTGEALSKHRGKHKLPLIAKPYRQGELARKIRSVLQSRD